MNHKLPPCYLVPLFVALFFFLIPATAWSRGGPPPDPAALIDRLDLDGDGQISADEFKGPEDHFSRMDTDGDGYLTEDELENGRPGPPPGGDSSFEKDDVDGDGMVSAEEFSGPADFFERMDADGDGYITQEEIRPQRGMGGPGAMEQMDEDQ